MARIYVRPIPTKKNSAGGRCYTAERRENAMIDRIDNDRSERGRSRAVEIGNGASVYIGDDGLFTYTTEVL